MAIALESRPSRWHGGRRTTVHVTAERESERLARTLGAQVAGARRAKGWTQAQLGDRVGLSQSRISSIEDGHGAGAPIGVWVALGIVLEIPLAVALSRPVPAEPQDAGHLPGQELLLALARRHGRHRTVELATNPSSPRRMVDVCVRDDTQRVVVLQEYSNRIDDLGQTIRDHRLKVAEAEGIVSAMGGPGTPYRVALCWVLRATAANRALLLRFPEVIDAAFPGSSRAWVRALAAGGPIPREPGLVWVDVAGTRLLEHRRLPSRVPHRRGG